MWESRLGQRKGPPKWRALFLFLVAASGVTPMTMPVPAPAEPVPVPQNPPMPIMPVAASVMQHDRRRYEDAAAHEAMMATEVPVPDEDPMRVHDIAGMQHVSAAHDMPGIRHASA